MQHNTEKTKSLKGKGPFFVVYTEQYLTKQEAFKREQQIKSYKGGNAFKLLVKGQGEMLEWLNRLVSKTSVVLVITEGSNPSLSAK